jgi:hypothetical protein
MKSNKVKAKRLLFAIFFSVLFFVISGKTQATSQNIVIDVKNILADVSNNPIGIGLHFAGDNLNVTEPLKDLKVGTLRFATSEAYLFDKNEPNNPKVSIQDSNLSIVKGYSYPNGTWWGGLKKFDDFMSVCQATKAEPFVIVPIDAIVYAGSAPHASPEKVLEGAVEWVKYANIQKGYNVKYWEIGNENNLSSEQKKISWTPEKYAETVVKFSQAMKAVDPSIKIGANGMLHGTDDWWNRIMPTIKNDVDFLITHQYSWIKDYQEWKSDPYEYDFNIIDAIKAIDKYNPSLKLDVTEISSFNTSANISHKNVTWKMLHNFEMLGQTLRFDKVDYVHFWTSRWLEKDASARDFSAFDSNYKLMPMGYPLKVWNSFLQKKMVFATKQAGVIRSWASYNPESNSLSIFLLNKDNVAQNVSVTLKNYIANTQNERWILKGSTPESKDITFKKSASVPLNGSTMATELSPLSVTVITFKSNAAN